MNRTEKIRKRIDEAYYEGYELADDIQHLLYKLEKAEEALENIYDCGSLKQAEIISGKALEQIRT